MWRISTRADTHIQVPQPRARTYTHLPELCTAAFVHGDVDVVAFPSEQLVSHLVPEGMSNDAEAKSKCSYLGRDVANGAHIGPKHMILICFMGNCRDDVCVTKLRLSHYPATGYANDCLCAGLDIHEHSNHDLTVLMFLRDAAATYQMYRDK